MSTPGEARSSVSDACAQSDNGRNGRLNYEPQTQTSLRALNRVLTTSRDHVGDNGSASLSSDFWPPGDIISGPQPRASVALDMGTCQSSVC